MKQERIQKATQRRVRRDEDHSGTERLTSDRRRSKRVSDSAAEFLRRTG